MDQEMEQHYFQLAVENSDILCSQAPPEILQACASEAEPTKFLEEYFAAGYSGWLAKKLGRRISLPQDRIDQAIIVLWYRACLLDTDRLMGQQNADADRPFFSDEGLY